MSEIYLEYMELDDIAFAGDTKKAKKARHRALNRAHEIRKFEIGLYWQRALFFWGFQVVILLVLGSILKEEIFSFNAKIETDMQFLTLLLWGLGFLTALGLVLVNKASKD